MVTAAVKDTTVEQAVVQWPARRSERAATAQLGLVEEIGPGALTVLQIHDLVVFFAASLVSTTLIGGGLGLAGLPTLGSVRLSLGDVAFALGIAVLCAAVMAVMQLYRVQRQHRGLGTVRQIALVGMLCLLPAAFSGPATVAASQAWIVLYAATLALLFGTRWLLRWSTAVAQAERHVLILGTGPRALAIYRQLMMVPGSRYQVVGFIDSECHSDHPAMREHLLGGLDELESLLAGNAVDELIQRAIEICETVGVEVSYPADIFNSKLAAPRYETTGAPGSRIALKMVHDDVRLGVKRTIDVIGSAAGLILLAPLFLAIALAVRLTSPGPAFFAQERYGHNRRRFRMWKFRTMVDGAEQQQAEL
jgi:hypothetical protein